MSSGTGDDDDDNNEERNLIASFLEPGNSLSFSVLDVGQTTVNCLPAQLEVYQINEDTTEYGAILVKVEMSERLGS